MSLRKFLFIPLLVSLVFFVVYSSAVSDSLRALADTVHITHQLVTLLALAAILQVCGHIVRACKAQFLLRPVKESSTRFQFRALSVGYLFNSILPLRLGELIRARIISGAMTISFSFALVLIIFERAVDALILGFTGLLLVSLVIGTGNHDLIPYILLLCLVAFVVFVFIALLINENRKVLKVWFVMTNWLNEGLRNSFRFKAWSVIYGLQRTLRPTHLLKYFGLTILSWLFYAASLAILVHYFFPNFSIGQKGALTAVPYYGVAVPAGPANLGVFSKITNGFSGFLHMTPQTVLVYDLITWGVLVIPIALIGFGLLCIKTKESLWQRRPKQASQHSLINKLSRSEDISSEMAGFLENYFSGNGLSRIVHRLEQQENFRLLKYFKGGSDAITILALEDGKQIVKKIIPPEFENRLKAQYDWLDTRKGCEGIVEVLAEQKTAQYYSIDLAYRAEDVMLFDFMHHNPQVLSEKVLEEAWGYLFRHVYGKPQALAKHIKERQQYIDIHIFGCLEKAAAVNPELLRAAEPETIHINGKEYDNLYQVMEKIRLNRQAWGDIAPYRQTLAVHGDVAVDNILVSGSTGKALLIDPAPDGNIINGPVFDFGKNMQSLYCGYEFMLRDEDPVYFEDGTINYRDHSSAQYNQLCRYVREELAPKYLSKAEQKAMLFHAGALHIRRLKHQVYYCPANTLKFYAIGIKTLNDFLAQYDQEPALKKQTGSRRSSYKAARLLP